RQFVGDIVVFGKELARKVEGNCLRPVLRRDPLEFAGDVIERLLPAGAAPGDLGMEQPGLERQRLAERRALRAETPEVGGVAGITVDRTRAVPGRRSEQAAAHPAVWTGGAGGSGHGHQYTSAW